MYWILSTGSNIFIDKKEVYMYTSGYAWKAILIAAIHILTWKSHILYE